MNKLLILLLLSGCFFDSSSLKRDELSLLLSSAYRLKLYSGSLFGTKNVIERPSNVWLPIAKFDLVEILARKTKTYCAFYKVPGPKEENGGVLKFVPISKGECRDQFLDETKWTFDDLSEFSVHMEFEGNEAWKFQFIYDQNDVKRMIEVPLVNVRTEKFISETNFRPSKKEEKLLGNRIKTGFAKNLLIWPLLPKEMDLSKRSGDTKYLGSFQDDFSEDQRTKCFHRNKNGKILINQCDQCRLGSYQVITKDFPYEQMAFCGPNRCGGKGQNACIRGVEFSKVSMPGQACFEGSFTGICNKDLHPVCSGDGILICL